MARVISAGNWVSNSSLAIVTGAASTIAKDKLAQATLDDYTIGTDHLGANVVNGLIYENLNCDPPRDLVPTP